MLVLTMNQDTAGPHNGGFVARYMTADDWMLHREQITRVYRDENKTLKRTMDIFEAEHSLKATWVLPHGRIIFQRTPSDNSAA